MSHRIVKFQVARARRLPAEPVGEDAQVPREHGLSWLVELFHEADWRTVFKQAFSQSHFRCRLDSLFCAAVNAAEKKPAPRPT